MSDLDWSVSGAEGLEPNQPEAAAPRPTPIPGERLGPFSIREELGRGGMGVVLRAHDEQARRDVALKVLLHDLDPDHLARFQREGQITAALNHPGIVRVHAAGDVDGRPFLAYELVEGARPLDHDWETLPRAARVLRILDAARAIGFAHARGVVHRDVKAANLLLDGAGRVRVSDFGLAAAQSLERMTQTGAMIGTPAVMAPEQMHGDAPVGPPADVWSLGVILYQALTGGRPFLASTLIELSTLITTTRPTPPRAVAPDVSPALEAVCLRALERDPKQRQPDAAAFARELELALAGTAPQRSSRLGRWVVAAVGLLAVVFVAASRPDDPQVAFRQQAETIRETALGLLRSRGSLRPQRAQVAALQSQIALLRAQGASGPALDEAQRTTEAIAGLADVALGHVEGARRIAADLPPDRWARFLRAALQTELGVTPSQARAIQDQLTPPVSGCRFAELRVWQARARAAGSETLSEQEARRLLSLLAGRAAARPDRIARARLELRLGRAGAAEQTLVGLVDPPRDLILDLVWLALSHSSATDALARLHTQRVTPGEIATWPLDARRALRARALKGTPERLLQTRLRAHAPLDMSFPSLRLARLLVPEPLPDDILDQLIDLYRLRAERDATLALAISDLAPRSARVHQKLVERLEAVFHPPVLKVAEEVVFPRALALAKDQAERDRVHVVRCLAFKERRLYPRCIALATEILPRLTGHRRGLVLQARGEAREATGDFPGALDDFDHAISLTPRSFSRTAYYRARVLMALGRPEAASESALAYARTGSKSTKLTDAVRIVWTGGHAKRPKEASLAVEHLLRVNPDWPGWWIRAAWLRLVLGRPAKQVVLALQTGADGLASLTKHPKARDLAPTARRLAARAQTETPAELRPALQALVQALETIRGGDLGP